MMKLNNIKNDKGTILIFVMIIITFLLVIGSSLLSLSMMAFRNNFTTKKLNQAYYVNDVLAEEVLAKIDEITHYADVSASEYVFTDKSHQNEEWNNMVTLLDHKVAEVEITQEEADEYVRNAIEMIYEQEFFEFILKGFSSPAINFVDNTDKDIAEWTLMQNEEITFSISGSGLKDDYFDLIENIKSTSNLEGITINSVTINNQSFTQSDKLVLEVETNGQYGSLVKKIELEVKIHMPEYNFAVSNMREIQLFENDAAKKAISTEENILIVDGTTNITGDIYAYGTFPGKRRIKPHEKGGVVVGYQEVGDDFWTMENHLNNYLESSDLMGSANVTVNGNVATRSGIHLMSNNSSLSVSESTFSDIVSLEENAKNTSISIDKNMYLYEDLYINGNGGNVTVGKSDSEDGEIWGLFYDDPSGRYNDHSSSIIINADSRFDDDAETEKISANKYMINGVAYQNMYIGISPETGEFYQTGESIVPNTEYKRYYQEELELRANETKRAVYKHEDTNEESYLYVLEDETSSRGDLEYKIEHFYRKAKLYDGTDAGITDEDKGKITFETIKNVTLDDSDLTKNFARGVVVSSGKVISPQSSMDEGLFIDSLGTIVSNVDLQACFLGERDYSTNANEQDRLAAILDFSITDVLEVTDLNNFTIYNSHSDKSIFINLPSKSASKEDLAAGNIVVENADAISGLIVTKGNVYIYADSNFSFNGTIIAKGDIVFYGNGTKTITNDDIVVRRLLSSDYKLRKLFRSDTGSDVKILDGKEMDGDLNMTVSYDPADNNPYPELTPVESQDVTATTIAEVKAYDILSWKEVY